METPSVLYLSMDGLREQDDIAAVSHAVVRVGEGDPRGFPLTEEND